MPNWFFNLGTKDFKSYQISKSLGQFKYLEYLDLFIDSLCGNINLSPIGNLFSLSMLNFFDKSEASCKFDSLGSRNEKRKKEFSK